LNENVQLGALIVKGKLFETVPASTVTLTADTDATRFAGTEADSCVELMNEVGVSAAPFHWITEPAVKLVPNTFKVNEDEPAII
jgi:hypothetical protein